ncbi:hypothetical protein [Vulcanisaeta sp. JCM 16159]|uniref:hypothetical protein n=1 Tax=Vulcanisaeta sp. JCM 16159 TaxID=1295371 RepID=UPI001FB1D4FA|nr:hypothetical protein [Vulcanisaeta sp. JCM 16159]
MNVVMAVPNMAMKNQRVKARAQAIMGLLTTPINPVAVAITITETMAIINSRPSFNNLRPRRPLITPLTGGAEYIRANS